MKYMCTGTDRSLVLCGSIQQGKRDQPVGCIFHAACRKLSACGISGGLVTSGSDHCRNVSGRTIFLSEICARWELYSHCFRCFRSLHCTATEKTASKDAVACTKKCPSTDRTSRRRIAEDRGRLFPMSEMHRYLSKGSISIQELKD